MFEILRIRAKAFWHDQDGIALTEALIVLPVLIVFTFGILEFGNILVQRQQLQTGVRDAARYWSRCRPDFSNCSLATARNIAFYGNPAGTGALRVPNWSEDSMLVITPETPPGAPVATDLVEVTGTVNYLQSPVFALLLDGAFSFQYVHRERYIGW